MRRTTQPTICGRQRQVRAATRYVTTAVILTVLIAASSACADSEPTAVAIRRDTELVGMWQGPVTGPYGGSVLTLRLRAASRKRSSVQVKHVSAASR